MIMMYYVLYVVVCHARCHADRFARSMINLWPRAIDAIDGHKTGVTRPKPFATSSKS
jgi:hypothetical protein